MKARVKVLNWFEYCEGGHKKDHTCNPGDIVEIDFQHHCDLDFLTKLGYVTPIMEGGVRNESKSS